MIEIMHYKKIKIPKTPTCGPCGRLILRRRARDRTGQNGSPARFSFPLNYIVRFQCQKK